MVQVLEKKKSIKWDADQLNPNIKHHRIITIIIIGLSNYYVGLFQHTIIFKKWKIIFIINFWYDSTVLIQFDFIKCYFHSVTQSNSVKCAPSNILVFSMGSLRLHNHRLFLLLLECHPQQTNRGVALHSHQSFPFYSLASCVHHLLAARITHLLLSHQSLKKDGKKKYIRSLHHSQYSDMVYCGWE